MYIGVRGRRIFVALVSVKRGEAGWMVKFVDYDWAGTLLFTSVTIEEQNTHSQQLY